jgi:hypothetical protein
MPAMAQSNTVTVPMLAYSKLAMFSDSDCASESCTLSGQTCHQQTPTPPTIYCCNVSTGFFTPCGSAASAGGGPAFGTIGTAVADTGGDTLAVNDSATIDFTTADNPESVTAAVVANSIGPTQVDETAGYVFSALGNTTLASGSRLTRSGMKVKEVCASGQCEFTTICGATCSSATSDCVAGSAIQAIKDAADFSPTNPYAVVVRPGLYDECVAVNDVTDVSLVIEEGARIVPTVADFDDVSGGVIRIANNTTAEVERIAIVSDGYVRNDAFSSPESALTVGVEACTGAAPWNDVLVVGGTWVGNHDGIHVCGSNVDSDTATDVPRITIRDLEVFTGADTIVKKVSSVMKISNVRGLSMTNYCETATADVTDLESGTVDATGASTTTFTLDGDANTTEHAYVGRHGRLTGGTCAAGLDFWVRDYTAAKLVTTTGSLGLTPDATCSYSIDAVVNASEAPCNEIDWTVVRGTVTTTPHGYWKNTGLHFGYIVSGSNPAPDLDLTEVHDTTFRVEVNDFGPADGSSACTPASQQHISGILAYVSGAANHFQRAVFDNVHVDVENNTVMRSSTAQSDNLCPYPLTGLSIPSTVFEDEVVFTGDITVRNTADPGAEDYGVVLLSASTLRLPEAHIVVENSVGGYAGSTAHLVQTAGTLSVGRISSDVEVTSSGTIAYEHQRQTIRRTAAALTARGETRVPASGDGFFWYDSAQREAVSLAGQIGGTGASPDVRGVRESGGPTLLSMGAVVDGECLARSGTTIDGVTCGGGSSEFSDEGTVLRPGDATDDYVRVSGATNGPAVGSADDASVCLAPSGGASPACEVKVSRSSETVTIDRSAATEVIYDFTNSGAGASKVRADSLESAGATAGCLTQTEDSPGTNTVAWCAQASRTNSIVVNAPDEAGTHVALTETAAQTATNKTVTGGDSGAGTTRPSGSNILSIRTHNTDCTTLTDGKQGEQCADEDDGKTWVCVPTAGDCSGAEWLRVDATGAGGGDAIRIEDGDNAGTFTAMSDADFDDSGDINFTRAAGPPDVMTATVRADSVALTTDTTGNYAAGDGEAGAALTGDSATGFFAAGALEDARVDGSLEADEVNPTLGTQTQGDYLASCVNGLGITGCPALQENGSATPAFDTTATLAGNPALAVEECVFTKDGTGSGWLCEGSTADTNEQLHLFPNVNGADTTDEISLLGQTIQSSEADATFFLDSESLAGDVSGTVGATVVDDVQTATANLEAADNSSGQVATTSFVQQEINGAGGAGLACSSGSCATASSEQNFLASGALTCGASTAGKAQVHTTPLQYCDNAGTPTLQYAAYGASDGDALAGDSATAFFDAGTIDEARLDANVCLDNEASTWASAGTQVFNDPVSVLPDATNGVTVNSSGLLAKAGTGSIQADDVVCTGCVVSTDVASLDVSDDLNLTAGRSLTLTGDDVAADAELYTDTKCMVIEAPVDADNLLFWRVESAVTVTGIDCIVNAATSAVITVQECNSNGASCTTTEAAITCATTNTTEASGIDDAAWDATDWTRIDVGTVTGTVGHVAVCVTFTVND